MIKEPFQIDVNAGQYNFEVSPEMAQQLDIIADGNAAPLFHLIREGKAFHAELISVDYTARTYTIRVNGHLFALRISDHYERLVQQMGLHIGGVQKQNTLKAPMPGLVLEIMVTPGQSIEKGDTLLILEAMKMENVLKAASDGIIKSIAVERGAAVEKGQLLLEME